VAFSSGVADISEFRNLGNSRGYYAAQRRSLTKTGVAKREEKICLLRDSRRPLGGRIRKKLLSQRYAKRVIPIKGTKGQPTLHKGRKRS